MPTSDGLNADNEQLELEGSIVDYMTAYFGVDQGDPDAMRYHLHIDCITRSMKRKMTELMSV